MATLTLIQSIRDILRPEIVDQQGGAISLREEGEKSTCEEITLHKSGPALVVKLDRPGPSVFPLFRSEKGLCSVCDYIIFYAGKDEAPSPCFYVFLCELKSTKVDGSRRQIENTKLLTDHILAMARYHRTVNAQSEVRYRGLVFSKSALGHKARLRREKCEYTAFDDRLREIEFAYLPSGFRGDLSYFCA